MQKGFGPTGVIGSNMALAPQAIAVGDQTLQAHGPPGRQGLGADAHLGAEAIAEAIGKAGGAIEIDASTIHGGQKAIGRGPIGRANGIGMAGAKGANVLEGSLQIRHHLDGQNQVGVLGRPVLLGGGMADAKGHGRCIPPQLHPGGREGPNHHGHKLWRDGLVHQQGFDGIAGRRVLGFGIQGHPQGQG